MIMIFVNDNEMIRVFFMQYLLVNYDSRTIAVKSYDIVCNLFGKKSLKSKLFQILKLYHFGSL